MKINILTPIRKGGPYNWGKCVTYLLNKKEFIAEHVHGLKQLLISPIYQNADMIHTTVPVTYRLWRKPTILTIHGEYPIEKNIWRHFYPIAIKKADVITTPSKFLKERLNLTDAIVIPNAIFPEKFYPIKHLDKHTINLLTITKFYFKDKGESVLNIIRILENIQKNTDKMINYTIVGGGAYLEQVMEKAKDYKNVNVKFTGMVSNPKEFLEKSDIFLYYSNHDNFPIVFLEAMACGLPIVTNNVGATSEIIENMKNGYVAKDDKWYSEYLLNLIESPKIRQKIGENSRKAVENKFNWNKIINEYINIYIKI